MGEHQNTLCWIPDYQGKLSGPAPRAPQTLEQKHFQFLESAFEGTSLKVEGRDFGTVVASTEVYDGDQRQAVRRVPTPPLLIRPPKISKTSSEHYETSEELTDAIWKSLCFGIYEDTQVKKYREMFTWLLRSPETPDKFRVRHDEIDTWLNRSSDFHIGEKRLRELSFSTGKSSVWRMLRKPGGPRYEYGFDEEEEFIQKITATMVQGRKKLVVLSTGAIGVVDEYTQLGDVVCKIKGCIYHVVLRHHSKPHEWPNKYGVVGTGFIATHDDRD
jgi:hypothetical protein